MEPSEDHVKIDSIKLTVNGLKQELTPEQACDLFCQLDGLFGGQNRADPVYFPCREWPDHKCNLWINPNSEPFPDHWVVGYTAHNNKSCLEINLP